tara:strand:+ start:2495 stop:2887 length:393 start_codon:yes stop_codon:yes gene_type:complete
MGTISNEVKAKLIGKRIDGEIKLLRQIKKELIETVSNQCLSYADTILQLQDLQRVRDNASCLAGKNDDALYEIKKEYIEDALKYGDWKVTEDGYCADPDEVRHSTLKDQEEWVIENEEQPKVEKKNEKNC